MSWDNTWEQIFQQQEWGKYPGEDLIRFVARNFYKAEDRQAVKLLEVGCGPGANIWYMAREGFTVYGVEGSETAVQRARARLDKECPGWSGEILVGDIVKLPFEAGLFDAVIDNGAVTCNGWDASRQIYLEMMRVCKPGGKLFSRTFSDGCWGEGTGTQVGPRSWHIGEGPLVDLGLIRFTTRDEIGKLLEGAKLLEVELLSRTMESGKHAIKEWIIIAENSNEGK